MSLADLLALIKTLDWPAEQLAATHIRVSVMNRHKKTLPNDGIIGEQIDPVNYDLWWREFSVPGKVVGAYYRKEITFDDLGREYLKYLRSPEIHQSLLLLIELSRIIKVVLMCIEDTAELCHRRILLEECARIAPELVTNLA